MSLCSYRLRLLVNLKAAESALSRCSIERRGRRMDRSAVQEGLVSNIWQSWGNFCRDVLISSAKGTTTQGGIPVSSPHSALTSAEIKYFAMMLARKQTVKNIRASRGSHEEPTWGDVNKITLIANGLGLTNANTLAGAFSAAQTIKDLQTCRNASAHFNETTVAEVRALSTRYNADFLFHPSDLIHWVDIGTKDFLWRSWIDEMDIISELAIQ